MKNTFTIVACAALLASCSSDEIVDPAKAPNTKTQIAFSTLRQNVTKASNYLQDNKHYNFGVYASKYSPNVAAQVVMENYLVGFGGNNIGYEHSNGSTWSENVGSLEDHKSPWFYEGLGTTEYTYSGNEGYYTASQTEYMSANPNQYLRYWDLAFTNTNFFCYTPYCAAGISCAMKENGSADITFTGSTIRDHYDNPVNSSYIGAGTDPSITEFMYAGVKATNADLKDIVVPFKHMGAQMFIRFYEDIPGYKVELVDLSEDEGNIVDNITADQKKGVQATPAVMAEGFTYTKGSYYTTSGGKITFDAEAQASFVVSTADATSTQENLMFAVPAADATYPSINVPTTLAANLTDFEDYAQNVHKTIPNKVETGADQIYSWSPTVYYPVAQPATQQTGFTFHVSFRIIAEDNHELITVHNATVHVPADKTTWKDNTRYIYTFLITRRTSGSTDPGQEIDPTDPTPGPINTVYPIVFDGCTIEDYTTVESEHPIH